MGVCSVESGNLWHLEPEEHLAIGNDWIISGQISGSVLLNGQALNAQSLAQISGWINDLWYNQQRFINY